MNNQNMEKVAEHGTYSSPVYHPINLTQFRLQQISNNGERVMALHGDYVASTCCSLVKKKPLNDVLRGGTIRFTKQSPP